MLYFMPAIILSGTSTRDFLLPVLIERIGKLSRTPKLAIIQVGNRPDSTSFINGKKAFAARIGVIVDHTQLPESVSQEELVKLISERNADASIQGIILQLPIPAHIDRDTALNAIDPRKDVDALTSYRIERWTKGGSKALFPATARGIRELLEHYEINLKGKKVCVVGRSALVGTPIACMCRNEGATVTVCHSKTPDVASETRLADIVIAAIGKPRFIQGEYVKEGQVVIDVGISKSLEEKLAGDVDFEAVKEIVSAITPVPGGVGPMTVLGLFENLVDLCGMSDKI